MKRCLIIIMLLLATQLLQAQKDTIKNLVFEGAGIRGIAYAGAISDLEKGGMIENVQRVGGTSAGAITAMMLSLSYTASEISSLINSTSFQKFNDGKFGIIGGINRLNKYYGWYRGKKFERWLSAIIAAKTSDPDITFGQLHQKGYKDLYVTATSLTKQQLVVFSREYYPHMKIKDAVRISMSIPMYFEAVFVDSLGSIFHHPKNKAGLDVMVDGGFTGNFPIRIFDSTKYINGTALNSFAYNPQTLGFRIDSDAQVELNNSGKGLAAIPVQGFKDYLKAFYTVIMENLNRQTLTEADWKRTVSISDGGVGPRIRRLQASEVKILVDNGSRAVTGYFKSNAVALPLNTK